MTSAVGSILMGLCLCLVVTWAEDIEAKNRQYVCPKFDPAVCLTAKPGPDECKDDSQCTYPYKCCCSNCGLQCIPPVQVKNGRCPNLAAKCQWPFPKPECNSDNECPGIQKCCEYCGKSCFDPDPGNFVTTAF
ncbi:WAP four-disulfide core domain protein 5-like [Bombina bombina]|uniref:WAP four-disulfide core domain protein 5-like n=1 Tax=Bombina bombina TaxID=8345 RepID=UPI00235B071B|nr:WAP four-disulfide core domain protein 5-like [Bombina bombina]